MTQVELGNRISELRHHKGLTQQKFADLLAVSNKTVSRWERGNGVPDVTLLPVIADIFGITVDELLCGDQLCIVQSASDKSNDRPMHSVYPYIVSSIFLAILSITLLCSFVFVVDMIIVGIVIFLALWVVSCSIVISVVLKNRQIIDTDIAYTGIDRLIKISFADVVIVLWTLVLALPILFSCGKVFDYNIGEYVYDVLSVYEYYDWLICICLVFPYLFVAYLPHYARMVGCNGVSHERYLSKKTVLSDVFLISAGILLVLYPMIDIRYLDTLALALAIMYLVISFVIDVLNVFGRENIFVAIRNALLIIPISFLYRLVDVVRDESTFVYSLAANYPLWITSAILEIMLVLKVVEVLMNRGEYHFDHVHN